MKEGETDLGDQNPSSLDPGRDDVGCTGRTLFFEEEISEPITDFTYLVGGSLQYFRKS